MLLALLLAWGALAVPCAAQSAADEAAGGAAAESTDNAATDNAAANGAAAAEAAPEAGETLPETLPEAEGARVAEVVIEGAKEVPEQSIREVMRLKGAVWWQPATWFRKRPRFSREQLDMDLGRVEDLYQAEGFYRARITPEVTPAGRNAVSVRLKIEEGPRTTVAQIALNVEGESPGLWQERLSVLLPLGVGEPFTAAAYNQAKAVLAERLLNEGFPRAEVVGDVVVVRSLSQAFVNLGVRTGPVGYFGDTSVKGVEVYEEKYVRRELTYRPGELFQQRRLEESQRRILSLGLFSTVLVRPQTLQMDEEGRVPVEVELSERKRYTTRLGIGYGSEDEFRFQASWTLRRFLGDLRLLTLAAKYSALVAGLQAGFTQPYFIDRKSNLYDNLELRRDTLEAYSTDSANNRLIIDRVLSPSWTVYGGHRLELTKLFNVTQVEAIPGTIPRDSLISAAELGATRDTTTDPYYPDSGSQIILAYEQATQALLSDLQYLRGIADGRIYRQLYPQVVLALRLRLGIVLPTEETPEVPIFKRFFTGGTNSVRGYGFQQLGPLDAEGRPLGGVSLTEGNLELRFPVWKKLFGVTFVDFGKVSLDEFDYSPNGLRFSAGLGARYRTVVGPIRLDWAYKLNPDPRGEPGRWRIHFSIGQAF
jgi:outer membrane protein insertion porin family/translocation and assembly module TamA